MKKLLVALTVIGIMVGSLATFSLAADDIHHKQTKPYVSNRHNGSYYYDVGCCEVTPDKGYRSTVTMYLKKNGEWQGRTFTKVPKNSTITCYSGKLQGKGATAAAAIIIDYPA